MPLNRADRPDNSDMVDNEALHVDGDKLAAFAGGRRKTVLESEYNDLIAQVEQYQAAFGSALVILPDGVMQYRRFDLSPTALTCPADMSEDEWRDIGEKLLSIQDAFSWYLGDWFVAGETTGGAAWAGTYNELAERFKYRVSSLKSYASVSRKITPLTRVNGLSFSHHRLVTKLSEEKRQEWLQRALNEGWSAKELAKRLKAKAKKTVLALSERTLKKRVDRIRQWASQVTDKASLAKYLRDLADSLDGKK